MFSRQIYLKTRKGISEESIAPQNLSGIPGPTKDVETPRHLSKWEVKVGSLSFQPEFVGGGAGKGCATAQRMLCT